MRFEFVNNQQGNPPTALGGVLGRKGASNAEEGNAE